MNGVHVEIVDGPLPPRGRAGGDADRTGEGGEIGAWLCFEGIVRAGEGGGELLALEYQAYRPMAERVLEELGRAMIERHGVAAVRVEHSVGRVAVGEVSFRLTVLSGHRKEALAAMDEFIDRLKKDVPIWKSPVWRRKPEGAAR